MVLRDARSSPSPRSCHPASRRRSRWQIAKSQINVCRETGFAVIIAVRSMPAKEPVLDIAHLGHIELFTPKPDESLAFFVDVLGMTVSGRKGESVYLRAWDDYERYSLKLTGTNTSGLGHAAFRARSQPALDRRVAALKGSGYEIGWVDDELGHGPAYRCHDPDGHIIELYYETERYAPPPELKPALKNQAQRYPARGVSVRRLD